MVGWSGMGAITINKNTKSYGNSYSSVVTDYMISIYATEHVFGVQFKHQDAETFLYHYRINRAILFPAKQ